MDPLELAKLQLDGLIAGIESGSSIAVQASELKLIVMFINMAQKNVMVPMQKS